MTDLEKIAQLKKENRANRLKLRRVIAAIRAKAAILTPEEAAKLAEIEKALAIMDGSNN